MNGKGFNVTRLAIITWAVRTNREEQ